MALILLLSGCGTLPRPFEGNVGQSGRMLAQPPPVRLAVAPPGRAYLTAEPARALAAGVVELLVEREVPAVVATPREGDWILEITALPRAGAMVPSYTLFDPAQRERGTAEGPGVAMAEWTAGRPETLRMAALAVAPKISDLLARIEADRKRSDPNSLVNRPMRVFLAPITGAPGDGNTSLALQMKRELAKLSITVQEARENADFVVRGVVAVTPAAAKQEQVEIAWIVTDAAGKERGKVVQLNEIPAGTLKGLWVDVAVVVAQEAAPGVKDVMQK